MSSAPTAPPGFSNERARAAARPAQGSRQRRAEADGAGAAPALDRGGARARPARGADPPGLLLRHARARLSTPTASSSARDGSRARAATRSSSCARSCRASCPTELRRSGAFRVEVDALPGGFVCSGTLKGTPDPADVRRAAQGTLPLRKLFSKEQRQLFTRRTRRRGSASTTSPSSGRSSSSSCASTPPELGRKLVAEMWLYPDGSRILELSTRAATNEAFQVAAETRAFLVEQRRRSLGRAGDEDAQGARVLRTKSGPERGAPLTPTASPASSRAGSGAPSARASAPPRASSASREPERVQESDELYLLSQESDASVKVRDGLMDVKRLEAVDGDGLEQWRPVLKAAFPLGARDVATVLDALGVAGPELAREAYTLEQLVDEVVEPESRPRRGRGAQAARPLHGRRLHGRAVGGAAAQALDAHDRRRVRGSRARDRGGARAAASPTGRTSASPAGSRRSLGFERACASR